MRTTWVIGSRVDRTDDLAVCSHLGGYPTGAYSSQGNHEGRPVRLVYTTSGQPTASVLNDDTLLVESVLYWVACKDINEANYLMAIINSDALYESVQSLMPKGQFGARHLHKHLWKLPIPEFDPEQKLHSAIAEAGAAAAAGAAKQLEALRAERGERLTVTIARREPRAWLRGSPEGAAVEGLVGRLLGEGSTCVWYNQISALP